jgi:hypothetical protein
LVATHASMSARTRGSTFFFIPRFASLFHSPLTAHVRRPVWAVTVFVDRFEPISGVPERITEITKTKIRFKFPTAGTYFEKEAAISTPSVIHQ